MKYKIIYQKSFDFFSQESLHKYFQYPVGIQTSTIHMNQLGKTIQKPIIYVRTYPVFDYETAAKYGYWSMSQFLAGRIEGFSVHPTWKGTYLLYILNGQLHGLVYILYGQLYSLVYTLHGQVYSLVYCTSYMDSYVV